MVFATCSEAAETTCACAAVSSAFALICWLTAVRSSEAATSVSTCLLTACNVTVTASRAELTVLATASSRSRLERLEEFGIDHGINYRDGNFVGVVQEVTNGHGADLIVDSVGGRTLEGSIAAAAYRGRISYVGSAGRDAYIPNPDALRPGNKSITGSSSAPRWC